MTDRIKKIKERHEKKFEETLKLRKETKKKLIDFLKKDNEVTFYSSGHIEDKKNPDNNQKRRIIAGVKEGQAEFLAHRTLRDAETVVEVNSRSGSYTSCDYLTYERNRIRDVNEFGRRYLHNEGGKSLVTTGAKEVDEISKDYIKSLRVLAGLDKYLGKNSIDKIKDMTREERNEEIEEKKAKYEQAQKQARKEEKKAKRKELFSKILGRKGR